MLLLVFADRHVGCAINQNVGGHQRWISIKTDRSVLAILAGLLFELCHAVEPAEPRHTIENPGELGVFGDLALVEYDILFGIDAAGEKRRGDLADGARQFARILPYGDGVQVDDAIDAIKAILQLDEALDGPEII